MLLSGGVDSTVCAALLHKALGPKNIVAVHINNGYMRKHETQEVQQALDDRSPQLFSLLGIPLRLYPP